MSSLVTLGWIAAPLMALAGVLLMVLLPPADRLWAWVLIGLAVILTVAVDGFRRRRR